MVASPMRPLERWGYSRPCHKNWQQYLLYLFICVVVCYQYLLFGL